MKGMEVLRNDFVFSARRKVRKDHLEGEILKRLRLVESLTVSDNHGDVEFRIDNVSLLIEFCRRVEMFLNRIYFDAADQ